MLLNIFKSYNSVTPKALRKPKWILGFFVIIDEVSNFVMFLLKFFWK